MGTLNQYNFAMGVEFNINNIEFVVKITISHATNSLVEDVVYYRRGMDINFVMRWQWFFQYLTAKVKVRHPHRIVCCKIMRMDMLTKEQYIAKKTEDLIKAKKATISKLNNKRPEWDLFGYNYTEWVEKVEKVKKDLQSLENGEVIFYVPETYKNNVKKWI